MSNKPDWAKGAELKRVYPDTKIKPFFMISKVFNC